MNGLGRDLGSGVHARCVASPSLRTGPCFPPTSHDRPKRTVLASQICRGAFASSLLGKLSQIRRGSTASAQVAVVLGPPCSAAAIIPSTTRTRMSSSSISGARGRRHRAASGSQAKGELGSWGMDPSGVGSHPQSFPEGRMGGMSQEVTASSARQRYTTFHASSRRSPEGQRVPGLHGPCGIHFLSGDVSETFARYDWPGWAGRAWRRGSRPPAGQVCSPFSRFDNLFSFLSFIFSRSWILKKIEKRRVTFISNRWLREPPFESRFWRSFDVTALPEGGVFPSPQTALLRAT